MDTESIKQIAEIIGGLGDDAKVAFIWYLVMLITKIGLLLAFGITAVVIGGRLIRRGIDHCSLSARIRAAANMPYTNAKDELRMVQCVEEHFNDYRAGDKK